MRSLGIAVGLFAIGLLSAAPTFAQVVQPPAIDAQDSNGVNLTTGKFALPSLNVGIGDETSGLERDGQSDSDNFSDILASPYAGQYAPDANYNGPIWMDASLDGQTHHFKVGEWGYDSSQLTDWGFSAGPYTEVGGTAKLSCATAGTNGYNPPSNCTLTLDNTTTVSYDPTHGGATVITRPNGEILTLTYYFASYLRGIKSVSSSLGWMLKYERDASYNLTRVTAYNLSVDYCDATASSCPASAAGYSAAAASTVSGTTTISQAVSGSSPPTPVAMVSYSTSGTPSTGIVTTVKSPNNVAKIVSNYSSTATATEAYRVHTVQIGASTWIYDYVPVASDPSSTTTIVTAPDLSTHSLVLSYQGHITSRTDELGRTTTYGYDTSGRINQVANFDATYSGTTLTGGYTTYHYDSNGNPDITTVYPKTSGTPIVTSATYPAAPCSGAACHLPMSSTDANGQITNYTYDSHGNLLSIIAPAAQTGENRQATFNVYTPKYPQVMNSSGVLVNSTAVDRLTSSKKCEVSSPFTSCDTSGSPWVKTDYLYDVDAGYSGLDRNLLLVKITASRNDTAATLASTTLYNKLGQAIYGYGPKASDDASSDLTSQESFTFYDSINRPWGGIGIDPDGSASGMKRIATRVTYNLDGQVVMQETGTVPTSAYAGATISDKWAAAYAEFVSVSGVTILNKDTTEYSPSGGSQPGLPVRTRNFSAIGVTSSTLESGVTETSYDNMFRVSCVAQRVLDQTTLHSLTSTTPNACAITSPAGIDGNDRIVQYTYDATGQVKTIKSGFNTPAGRTDATKVYSTGSTLDPAGVAIPKGMLVSVTDAKSNMTAFSYDALDRQIKTWFPSKTTTNMVSLSDYVQTTYSGTRVSSLRLRDGQTLNYAYDNLGRVLHITGAVVEDFTYDTFGRVRTHDNSTTGGGSVAHATYSYSALGSLLDAAYWIGTDPLTARHVLRQYDTYNHPIRLTWPDGFYVNYVYYLGGAPHYIRDNAGIYALRDEYDAYDRRNIKKLGNSSPYPLLANYAFDAMQRPNSLTNNLDGVGGSVSRDVTYGFGYNLANEFKSQTSTNTLYSFNGSNTSGAYVLNGLNQVASYNATSFAYDNRGNLTSEGAATFSYNANNLLTSVVAGPATTSLSYDAENRLARIVRTSLTPSNFIYDGTNLIAEYDDSGTLTARYIHGFDDDEPIVSFVGSGTADSDRHYLISDAHGSIVALTDNNGVPTSINAYDEFGLPESGNAGRFQYTGQVWLPEIGMYYYKSRIYEPTLGRFLQADPIGYGDGMNMYAYVHGDPVNLSDPTGLASPGGGGGVYYKPPVDCPPGFTDDGSGHCVLITIVTVHAYTCINCYVFHSVEDFCWSNFCPSEDSSKSSDCPAPWLPGACHDQVAPTKEKDPRVTCAGHARILTGRADWVGRIGGMVRPIRKGSAAVIPRQWPNGAGKNGGASASLLSYGASVSGTTSGGQTFYGLDEVMDDRPLAKTTLEAQDVLMSRDAGKILIELVTGADEGKGNDVKVTLSVPGSVCPAHTTPVG